MNPRQQTTGNHPRSLLCWTAAVALALAVAAWASPASAGEQPDEESDATVSDEQTHRGDNENDEAVRDREDAQPTADADEASDARHHRIKAVVDDDRSEEPVQEDLDEEQRADLTATMQQALQAEENEEYDESVDRFVDAYRIFPHSNILLSVSRVSSNVGEDELALRGYRQFLQRRPEYENRDQIEDRIEQLEARIEAEEQQEEPEEQQVQDDEPTDPLLSADLYPSEVGWGGIGAVALGTIGLIAGGATSASLRGDFEDLEAAAEAQNRSRYIRLSDDISSKQTRGKVFLYGGLGLVAAGAAAVAVDLFVLDHPPLFAPSTEGDRAGLSIGSPDDGGMAIQWMQTF